jgi:cyclophilin family peptidyl-prolyl cis-trans isomerase
MPFNNMEANEMKLKALLGLALLLVSCILLLGCKKESIPEAAKTTESTSESAAEVKEETFRATESPESGPAPEMAEPSEAEDKGPPTETEIAEAKEADEVAVFETTQGKIVLELYPDSAPITVANFRKLIKRKFYDGLAFHRYVQDFVIQGGDPAGDGAGGPGYTIADEFNERKHITGTVAMAHAGPNTAGSQFYICLAPAPHLDGSYTNFGQVIQGMDNVFKLRQGDKMTQVTLEEASEYPPEEQ